MKGDRHIIHPEDQCHVGHTDISVKDIGLPVQQGKGDTEVDRDGGLAHTAFLPDVMVYEQDHQNSYFNLLGKKVFIHIEKRGGPTGGNHHVTRR